MFAKMMRANYDKIYGTRFIEVEYIKYYKLEDFPGLMEEPVEFLSNNKQVLRGHVYYYRKTDKLCIFVHGMGSTHHSYMHEIEFLAKKGIMVMAYDGTGVGESDGKNRVGFSQALVDLDYAIRFFNQSKYKNNILFLMGHSQGAFAVENVLKLHSNVSKAVALSGPISCESIFSQSLGKLSFLFLKSLLAIEKSRFPDYYEKTSIDSLANTNTKVLLIHSIDDRMVSCEKNTMHLQKNLKNENITYFYCNSKNHNPNYEEDAVRYMEDTFAKLKKYNKKKNRSIEELKEYMKDVDFKRMTRQDPIIMNKICQFFDIK